MAKEVMIDDRMVTLQVIFYSSVMKNDSQNIQIDVQKCLKTSDYDNNFEFVKIWDTAG